MSKNREDPYQIVVLDRYVYNTVHVEEIIDYAKTETQQFSFSNVCKDESSS